MSEEAREGGPFSEIFPEKASINVPGDTITHCHPTIRLPQRDRTGLVGNLAVFLSIETC
jgi:hypothetical protein